MQGPTIQHSFESFLHRMLGLWPYILIAVAVAGLAFRLWRGEW